MSTISCSLKPVAAKVGAASTKSNSKHSVITRKPFNVTGTAVKSNVNGLVALGLTLPATTANAMPSLDQSFVEVTQLADVPTPLLYFGFLTTSLTFAAGTYIALSKIKLI